MKEAGVSVAVLRFQPGLLQAFLRPSYIYSSSTYLPDTSLGFWDTVVYEGLWLCAQVVDSLVEETDHKQVYKQTRLSKMVVRALKKIKQNKVMERSEG